ncbi:MAG: MCP four helix bundle domain-containing protein [Nitrosomonadales bacterium]|nr:MCP four helix bundle domain-containing protein [Nitrosomonadales bacterium]
MFDDIKINALLTILLALLLVGLMVVSGKGLYVSDKLDSSTKLTYEKRIMSLVQLNAISTANLGNRLAISNSIYHPDDMAKYIREIEKNKSVIDEQWGIYTATVLRDAPDDEEGKRLISKFTEVRGRFVEEAIKPALDAMRDSKLGEIKRIQVEHVGPLNAPLNEALNALIDKQIRDAKKAPEDSVRGFWHQSKVDQLKIGWAV